MSNMKKPRLSIPILPAVLMVLLASGGLFVSPTAAEAQQGGSDLMEVTFAEDVAPILYETCVVCHRPGSIAPMSLLDYETARQYAPLIKWRVENRKMPPWFIDKHAGIQEFKDDRSLSDAEITTIASWVDQGAPPGDLASLPPVPVFEDEIYEWTLQDELGREPDLIVPIPEPFTVPADGPNMWMEFVSESGLTEDRWIKAYETKPSLEGFPVVHHAGTSLMFPDGSTQGFSEYALGKTGDIFPPNTGRLIKAGTKMRWNVHYSGNPNGEDTTDRTRIALWFYPKGEEPKWEHIRRGARQHLGPGHSAGGRERPPRGVQCAEGEHPSGDLPAPHAQPGKPPVHERHLPGWPQADAELRELGFRLAHRLQLPGRGSAAHPQGLRYPDRELAQQLRE